jgi:hypothetical protein
MKGILVGLVALMLGALSVVSAMPARAAQSLESVPQYQHVGVLILENESFPATWGTGSVATYLNSLRSQGAFSDMYYADGHVSLDNYITMTSGLPGNAQTYSDCLSANLNTCVATVTAQSAANGSVTNVADQVEGAGLSWKEYADSMPSPCFHGDYSTTATPPDPYQGNSTTAPAGNYADRHNPVNYYADIIGNATRCAAHDVPFTALAADITANTVPNYFFISPDTCHDGHDSPCAGTPIPTDPCMPTATEGGLLAADCWLQQSLPSLLTYLNAHDGLLLITTDEGSTMDTSGCCTGGQGGQLPTGGTVSTGFGGLVGLLALGPGVATGTTTHHSYDHASLLRTTDDALGIGTYLNNAATATAMSDLFAPATGTPEAPLTITLPIAGVAIATAVALGRRRRRDRSPT